MFSRHTNPVFIPMESRHLICLRVHTLSHARHAPLFHTSCVLLECLPTHQQRATAWTTPSCCLLLSPKPAIPACQRLAHVQSLILPRYPLTRQKGANHGNRPFIRSDARRLRSTRAMLSATWIVAQRGHCCHMTHSTRCQPTQGGEGGDHKVQTFVQQERWGDMESPHRKLVVNVFLLM